jgi:predicted Zn-ribbon and HTH transcriptional regulator
MFAYLCRKCGSCSSEFILEQMEDPGTGQSGSNDILISNTCPNCRSDFVAESYFVLQSAEPLMQRMETQLQF